MLIYILYKYLPFRRDLFLSFTGSLTFVLLSHLSEVMVVVVDDDEVRTETVNNSIKVKATHFFQVYAI